jgi:hypothetical protein
MLYLKGADFFEGNYFKLTRPVSELCIPSLSIFLACKNEIITVLKVSFLKPVKMQNKLSFKNHATSFYESFQRIIVLQIQKVLKTKNVYFDNPWLVHGYDDQ